MNKQRLLALVLCFLFVFYSVSGTAFASDVVDDSTGIVYRTDFTWSYSVAGYYLRPITTSGYLLGSGANSIQPSLTYPFPVNRSINIPITNSYSPTLGVSYRQSSSATGSVAGATPGFRIFTGSVGSTKGLTLKGHIDIAFRIRGYVGDEVVVETVSSSCSAQLYNYSSTTTLGSSLTSLTQATNGRFLLDYTNPNITQACLVIMPTSYPSVLYETSVLSKIEYCPVITSSDFTAIYYPLDSPPASISGGIYPTPGDDYIPGNNESGGTPSIPGLDPEVPDDGSTVTEAVDRTTAAVEENTEAVRENTEETKNGFQRLIDSLLSLPSLIGEYILHLFVPEADDFSKLFDSVLEQLDDKFGILAQALTITIEFGQAIVRALDGNSEVDYVFHFPGIHIPLQGTVYTLVEEQDVTYDNAFIDILRPVLSTIVLIVCALALLNSLARLMEAVVVSRAHQSFSPPSSTTSAVSGPPAVREDDS